MSQAPLYSPATRSWLVFRVVCVCGGQALAHLSAVQVVCHFAIAEAVYPAPTADRERLVLGSEFGEIVFSSGGRGC